MSFCQVTIKSIKGFECAEDGPEEKDVDYQLENLDHTLDTENFTNMKWNAQKLYQ